MTRTPPRLTPMLESRILTEQTQLTYRLQKGRSSLPSVRDVASLEDLPGCWIHETKLKDFVVLTFGEPLRETVVTVRLDDDEYGAAVRRVLSGESPREAVIVGDGEKHSFEEPGGFRGSHNGTNYAMIFTPPEDEEPEEDSFGYELFDADPTCNHVIISGSSYSGVRCAKCRGWFCY